MITKEAVDNAIKAHWRWKKRLNELIDGKALDFDLEKAGTDYSCEFGKWLYSDTISEDEKKTDYYIQVRALHADFHKSVKEVAGLVEAGKNEDAKKMITDFNGTYNKISTKLILLLADWVKKV